MNLDHLDGARRFTRGLRHAALATLVGGCGAGASFEPVSPTTVSAGLPLEAEYSLVPAPAEADDLLGRAVFRPGEGTSSREATFRPNPCAAALSPELDRELPGTFEDAEEISHDSAGRAALERYGFDEPRAGSAYFHYRLSVTERVSKRATAAYETCCQDRGGCGAGFVSAVLYGTGEYTVAVESNAPDAVTLSIDGDSAGFILARVVQRRGVQGYVAVLVEPTRDDAGGTVGLLGDPSAVQRPANEDALDASARALYEARRIDVVALGLTEASPDGSSYEFRDRKGALTENEFVRRYRALASSHDLDGATSHPIGDVLGGLFLTGLGGGCVAAAASMRAHEGEAHLGSVTMGTVGALQITAGLLWTAFALASWNGTAAEHRLSKSEGELYVARYNQELLRDALLER